MPISQSEPPLASLHAQPVTVEQYREFAPEKFELLDGYLFYGPEDRRRLMRLLLVNLGLRETVKLIPEEGWREALREVYGR